MIPCAMQRVENRSASTPSLSAAPLARQGKALATLSEVFAEPGAEAAAAGFVLTRLAEGVTPGKAGTKAPVLWLQERMVWREAGRPYLPGLGRRSLLLMQLSRPADLLIAAEEGLGCTALAGVVAEMRGNPSALNFTALKRLALRAEASGVPCWLIRQGAAADLSAARDRWRIATLPSDANPDDPRAPGAPRWRLELFRSRANRPGTWVARHERAADSFLQDTSENARTADHLDLVAELPDGTLAEAGDAAGRRRVG